MKERELREFYDYIKKRYPNLIAQFNTYNFLNKHKRGER